MLGCQLHFKNYIVFQMIYMSIFFLYTPMYKDRVTENQSSFQQSAIFRLIIYVTATIDIFLLKKFLFHVGGI